VIGRTRRDIPQREVVGRRVAEDRVEPDVPVLAGLTRDATDPVAARVPEDVGTGEGDAARSTGDAGAAAVQGDDRVPDGERAVGALDDAGAGGGLVVGDGRVHDGAVAPATAMPPPTWALFM